MKKELPNIDLLRVAGLRPKKNPIPKKYASFNHRMIAATIDALILMVIAAPVLEFLLAAYYPPVYINYERIREISNSYPSGLPAINAIWGELISSGVIARHVLTLTLQTSTLLLYTAICWHYWAATPGKLIMRLRVVDATTEAPISTRQIPVRLFGYIIATLPLMMGLIAISFSNKRQGWHDRMAQTVVVTSPIPWASLWEMVQTHYRRFTGAKPNSPVGNPSSSPAPSGVE